MLEARILTNDYESHRAFDALDVMFNPRNKRKAFRRVHRVARRYRTPIDPRALRLG